MAAFGAVALVTALAMPFQTPVSASPVIGANQLFFPAPAAPSPAIQPDGSADASSSGSNPWDAGTTVTMPDGSELQQAAGPFQLLGLADMRATLEAIRFALTEVADGATYVWRRQSGPLHGIVRPTSSFRDDQGRVCRHIVLGVAIGATRRKVEGIACRARTGRWTLSG